MIARDLVIGKLRAKSHVKDRNPSLRSGSETIPWHAEGDAHYGFNIDGLAIFCAGAETPLLERFARVFIQALVHSLKYAYAIHAAITANDRVEHYHAFNAVMHQVLRIRGVNFANGFRGAQVIAGRT
jgi:hypothetical protein